ncbi:hypothetical protein M3Y94_00789100 [Aphelenchoides besseyi]|nr:hypothetical protein M3Y94_00789100 [Aphelenchoides besseyi]
MANRLFSIVVVVLLIHATKAQASSTCANGKAWRCSAHQIYELPDIERRNENDKPRVHAPQNFYVSYLNKVNPTSGEVYISARIKIELSQRSLENATSLILQIVPPENTTLMPVFYEAHLEQRRSIPSTYTVDFTFTVEDQLAYEHNYTIKFDLFPTYLRIFGQTKLLIPTYQLPPIDCTSPEVESIKRQRETSRWTTTFREFTFFPYESSANISFYAAPSAYCIDAYEIQLRHDGAVMLETYVLHASEMQQVNGVLVGTISIPNFQSGLLYTVQIVPFSTRHPCVCKTSSACGCVVVRSEPFLSPKRKSVNELSSTNRPQPLPIKITNDNEKSLNTHTLAFIIISFCVLCLTIVSIALVFLLCRTNARSNSLILLKTTNTVDKSLLSTVNDEAHSTTVLFINADPMKRKLISLLARLIEQNRNKLTVLDVEHDIVNVEGNLQIWCHDALIHSDKIVFFHSNRAATLLSSTYKPPLVDVYDTVFRKLMSLINFTDPRIIHACWDSNPVNVFGHVETKYSLPSFLHSFLSSLGTLQPSYEQRLEFENLYNRTMEATERIVERPLVLKPPTFNVQKTTLSSEEDVMIGDCINEETADSGMMITIDELESRRLLNDPETRSIDRSEDSGFVM